MSGATRVTTQYPSGEPLVLTAPFNEPMAIGELVNNSSAVASLQSQITALTARVTALEQAAASASTGGTTA
jgi:hypothetical protein